MKNNKQTILVTGANGQLGCEIKTIAAKYPEYHFTFLSKDILSVSDFTAVMDHFKDETIACCINCAAYTAVDKAESEKDLAFAVNAEGAKNMAQACRQSHVQLIHISTDYVFDGTGSSPYKETDTTHPLGVYGASKLKGEQLVLENDPSAIVIRTSWLYSSFGNNFVKTMLRLMKERESINVVNDQKGCPTYAADLAAAIMQIIASGKAGKNAGIYHYTNAGIITWYQFALAIKELGKSSCSVNPISTAQYPTAAKRPAYSVLDTKKIRDTFDISIPDWKASLQACLKAM
ncbi:MAG TPA: dTDP-4-dehydrorhamnose reductase [Ferruginibacter sp.]|nr:dTDP-4-dehydrorhamnose reductase [Ferruginibacter sp.]